MVFTAPQTKDVKLTVWQPFLVLVSLDIRRLRHEARGFITKIATIALSTVFIFNFVLPQLSGGRGQGLGVAAGYATVLAPGMIAVVTCNQALTSALNAMSLDLGPLRRIDQALMAPLPIPLIALTRIIDGTLRGVLGACITLPIVIVVHAPGAPPALDLTRWPLLLGTLIGAGTLFAALGMVIGTAINPTQISSVLPAVLPAMIMLGCVYYPWSALGSIPWLQNVVLANPVVYVTEATRFAITPQLEHLPVSAMLWAIGVGAILTSAVALTRFTKQARL
jgi:ABC-2 type transport system permease protein